MPHQNMRTNTHSKPGSLVAIPGYAKVCLCIWTPLCFSSVPGCSNWAAGRLRAALPWPAGGSHHLHQGLDVSGDPDAAVGQPFDKTSWVVVFRFKGLKTTNRMVSRFHIVMGCTHQPCGCKSTGAWFRGSETIGFCPKWWAHDCGHRLPCSGHKLPASWR